MKKRALTSIAAVVVALTTVTAFASSNPIMFGDNVQRTHENGIADQFPWSKEVFLGSGATGGISLASSSTAIGAGNTMFYPVSAPNNSPTGQGYMTVWDTGNWKWNSATNQTEPTLVKTIPITGVSNSSPVYDPATGKAYLAAGGTFYEFDSSGNIVNTEDISTSSPIDQNQEVSYPLYVTASQLGVSSDSIWVSSQNGHLYAINPSTLAVIWNIDLGERLDASPALVTATDGTSYIAVTAASNPNNVDHGGQSGTGMLFLVNPKTGLYSYLPNPSGSVIPSVASPIGISAGEVMWNDVDGDVFLGTVNPDGTVTLSTTKTAKWPNIGNSQTSDLSESGFSAAADEYIVPFTDKGTYGYAVVDPSTGTTTPYASSGASGQIYPIGSPEISAGDGSGNGNLYLADQIGGIDAVSANTTTHQFDGTQGGFLPSFGSSSGTPLSTPSELTLGTAGGAEEPTLTLATNQGLEMWVNLGANYSFGGDYTSTQPAQFTTPLALILGTNNLPTDKNYSDQIAYSMSVNGGPYNYVMESPVYSGSTPQPKITLSTALLKYLQRNSGFDNFPN